MKISVVIPVYGCRKALWPLYERLKKTLIQITDRYEIILVDDNCPQNSWEEIEKICKVDDQVTGIRMSRNFGQIRAITAGLDDCTGDWVVVMDCDLQDRPEVIIDLYNKACEGYDVVFARRLDRKDGLLKKLFSRLFYKVYNYFTDGNFDGAICNFNISKRIVTENYCKMREQNRAYTLFIKWLGFVQTTIDVEHDQRAEGKSSYNFRKKMKMASEFITAQSNKPLLFAVKFGFIIALCSFAFFIYTFIHFFISGVMPEGWTSLILSVYLMGGIILITVGIVGIYVGYIFNETKNRPLYVVMTTINKPIASEGNNYSDMV